MYENVAVVIPSERRPERLLRAIESVLSDETGVKVVAVLKSGDDESRGILDALAESSEDVKYIVLNGDGWHTSELWNEGAVAAVDMWDVDYFITGADDLIFEPGCIRAAMGVMQAIGGTGLVGLNEGPGSASGNHALATHFLVSRNYAATGLGGVIMPPPYHHNFTDVEATFRARRDGRLAFADDAKIYHEHPFYGRAEIDEIYEIGASRKDEDEKLFAERARAGFPNDYEPLLFRKPPVGWGKIAIGLRAYKNQDVNFTRGWTNMMVGGLRQGDRVIDIGIGAGKPHHSAANAIVMAFLKSDCDSLLLVDDDMIIQHDSLSRLRDSAENFDYDIVQAFATLRDERTHAVALVLADEQPGMPEIMAGQRFNALADLPEFGVTRVDAVGLAFTLIKRHVFESMISEYGTKYTTWFSFGDNLEMEDMRFSQKCRELGFKMCVDTNSKVGHLGLKVYGWDEYLKFVDSLEKNNG